MFEANAGSGSVSIYVVSQWILCVDVFCIFRRLLEILLVKDLVCYAHTLIYTAMLVFSVRSSLFHGIACKSNFHALFKANPEKLFHNSV